MVSFKVTKEESEILHQIAKRGAKMFGRNLIDLDMDITAVHANGNPLRLEDFLRADDFNFSHDISGIINTLDRETGQLQHGFSPRFTKTN